MIVADAPVETFDAIDSTMMEARRRAERGATGPVWFVARVQSAGRGRRGRAWVSEDGNLFTTYLSTTRRPPSELALLGFAAGLAIAEAIDEQIGAGRARLKWPNDVLIDGAKVSGLMLDTGSLPDGDAWAALGIGVNLAIAPHVGDQATTSVREKLPLGAPTPEPLAFLTRLQARLVHWDAVFAAQGFEPLRNAWLQRAHGLGAPARVTTGDTALEGRIAGLSARGELEFDTGEGIRLVSAGDVFLHTAA